jgi:hypothetical protein
MKTTSRKAAGGLAAELVALPSTALIIPLGRGAGEAVDLITVEDVIDARRCLRLSASVRRQRSRQAPV